jgi:hypothetical protein
MLLAGVSCLVFYLNGGIMQNKETLERLNNPPQFEEVKKVSLMDIIENCLSEFEDANMASRSTRVNIANAVYNKIVDDMTEVTTADEFNKAYLTDLDRNTLILKRMKEQLDKGQIKYGKTIPEEDGRNWITESLEEILDSLVYITNKLLIIEKEEKNNEVSKS